MPHFVRGFIEPLLQLNHRDSSTPFEFLIPLSPPPGGTRVAWWLGSIVWLVTAGDCVRPRRSCAFQTLQQSQAHIVRVTQPFESSQFAASCIVGLHIPAVLRLEQHVCRLALWKTSEIRPLLL